MIDWISSRIAGEAMSVPSFLSFCVQGIAAFVLSIFTNHFDGSILLFEIFLLFFAGDLICGIIYAVIMETFSIKKLGMWVWKLMKRMILVVIMGYLYAAAMVILNTYWEPFIIVNWVLFFYILSDSASILDKLDKMGFNVPSWARATIDFIRLKAHKTVEVVTGDPKVTDSIFGKGTKDDSESS